MEPDFSGYVTKAGLTCSDGRTITPEAFKHQHETTVPLVWQHGHTDPENVLGHVKLEARDDGIYGYGFFNATAKAKHAQMALEHKDFNALSIWANKLIERSKMVLHGMIREVSLALAGANPGATIEHIRISHSDDGLEDEILEDEAIITTPLELKHSDDGENSMDDTKTDVVKPQDVYDSMNEDQQKLLHSLIEKALDGSDDEDPSDLLHAGDETVEDVYNSFTDVQKQVVHFLIGEALASAGSAEHSDLGDKTDETPNDGDEYTDKTEGNEMKHNVFESDADKSEPVISHDDMRGILEDAKSRGSLKSAIESYALAHSIGEIDTLFPDAVNFDSTPQYLQRRVEWVGKFLGAARKSPFSRIKTTWADLTEAEARAKGYITGTLKKEEFFKVAKRVTQPTTVYKKQSIDRDDVVDITDFDVVVWLKAEMRLMLDEELARAALLGDGRDSSDEDHINDESIRPIASDHELYAVTVNVNIGDASSSVQEVIDAIVMNRRYYKGTGQPTMFTSETLLAQFLLLKDGFNRRMYKSLDEIATELRVSEIVPVEVLEEYPDILAVIVNPVDYVFGATRGGEVTMFDDFDIDYNKQKYLIETRCSGALVKLKSALVVRKVAGTDVLVAPAAPTFDAEEGELTIVDTAHVVYKNADTDATINAAGSPYSVASGETINVVATPAAGYYFDTSENDEWSFTAE